MGQDSKIEWTHHTFNGWFGCAHREIDGVPHPGCENCYAEAMMAGRWKKVNWGPAGTRIMTSPANWAKPIAWNKAAEKAGVRARVFSASLADVFEDWHGSILSHRVIHDPACPENGFQETDFNPVLWHRDDIGICEAGQTTVDKCRGERLATMDDLRRKLFALIDRTPWLDWQLLTKRPENVRRMWPRFPILPPATRFEFGLNFPHSTVPTSVDLVPRRLNVWLGTSVSNQKTADRLIPELLKCHELAPVLFLSAEPLVGPLDLRNFLKAPGMPDRIVKPNSVPVEYIPVVGLNQVIVGGESGHGARPMHPSWPRDIRDQCVAAGCSYFFKQWGEWHPESSGNYATGKGEYRYGKVNGVSMLRDGSMCIRNSAADPAGKGILVDGNSEFALKRFHKWANLPADTEKQRAWIEKTDPGYQWMQQIGKKAAGRMLDGREWSEFPRVAEGAAL